MKTKSIRELIAKLANKEEQMIFTRFGSILPDDDALQVDTSDMIFACDRCGEIGKIGEDFSSCPKCGNTNYANNPNSRGRYNIKTSAKSFVFFIKYETASSSAVKIVHVMTTTPYLTRYDVEGEEKNRPRLSIFPAGKVVKDGKETRLFTEKWNVTDRITLPTVYRAGELEFGFVSVRWNGTDFVDDENEETDFYYSRLREKRHELREADCFLPRKSKVVWNGKEPFIEYLTEYEYEEDALTDAFGHLVGRGTCGKCGHTAPFNNKYDIKGVCPNCGLPIKSFWNDNKVFFNVETSATEDKLQILLFSHLNVYIKGEDTHLSDKRILVELSKNGEASFYFWYLGEFLSTEATTIREISENKYDKNVIIEALKGFEGTQKTGFLEYDSKTRNKNPLAYLALFSEHPETELFAKGGFTGLIDSLIYHGWPKRLSTLKNTKSLRKLLSSVNGGTNIEALCECYNRDNTLDYDTFLKIEDRWRNAIDVFRVGVPNMSWAEIVKYLDYVDEFQACPHKEALQLWADYLKMYKKLGGDLTDRRAVYTNSLKREHDKAARKIQFLRDETAKERFDEAVNDEKYKNLSYSGQAYDILTPSSPEDMFEEGRQLNHCVGSYVDDVADRRSKILFVRDKKNLTKSLATMEVRGRAIVQLRGYSNNLPSQAVISFVRDYASLKGLDMCI